MHGVFDFQRDFFTSRLDINSIREQTNNFTISLLHKFHIQKPAGGVAVLPTNDRKEEEPKSKEEIVNGEKTEIYLNFHV